MLRRSFRIAAIHAPRSISGIRLSVVLNKAHFRDRLPNDTYQKADRKAAANFMFVANFLGKLWDSIFDGDAISFSKSFWHEEIGPLSCALL